MRGKKAKGLRRIAKMHTIGAPHINYEKQEYVGRVGGRPYLSARKMSNDCTRRLYQILKRYS